MRAHLLVLTTMLVVAGSVTADCPLDHLLIGCNPDGVWGTADDNRLFLDCTQKYRHSDPEHSGDPTWRNWHYPMYYNARYQRYQIGEPGFDVFPAADPNHALQGVPNLDYRLLIECVSISPGLIAHTYVGQSIQAPGDTINHSILSDPHLHLQYRLPAPNGVLDPNDMAWVTFRIRDGSDDGALYEPSEPVTIVFLRDPLPGDVVVDGHIGPADLARFVRFWLRPDACRRNDYHERIDANRDGRVDMLDFASLAGSWKAASGDWP
ncbi:MAG TPA: hypothetical protein ENN87_16490 [Phycisphaerales bacterium]|nr:hypothetical protein [Phycisphaerales bacterium]